MQPIYFFHLFRTHCSSLLSGLANILLANRLTIMIILLLALAASFAPTTWAAPVADSPQQTVPASGRLNLPLIANSAITPTIPFTSVNLTTGNGIVEVSPAWSPDGTKIAFHNGIIEHAPQYRGVYTILADGSQSKKVMDIDAYEGVAWSPDGSKLVFEGYSPADEPGFTTDIYLLTFQPDGSTQLTALTQDEELDESPVWTPDGSRIIFWREGSAPGVPFHIYAVNVDGSALTRLTKDPTWTDQFPQVSPDGSKIAFVRTATSSSGYCFRDFYVSSGVADVSAPMPNSPPPPPATQIYVMDADGSNPTAVTPLGCNLAPVWSADGSKIYFLSAPNYTTDLFVINVDGSQMTNLTNGKGIEGNPQLSPDGSQLLYWAEWRTPGGNSGEWFSHFYLIRMDVDGSHKTNLAYRFDPYGYVAIYPYEATWSPDGNKVAYTDHNDLFVINLDE